MVYCGSGTETLSLFHNKKIFGDPMVYCGSGTETNYTVHNVKKN